MAGLCAGLMVVSAQAAFQVVENFDSLTLGDINGQNGWFASLNSNGVELDPAGGSSQVLKVFTESGILHKAANVAQGTTRMLFLRFRFEEHGAYSFGLSHLLNPDEFSDFGPELGMAAATASDPGNDFRVANGLTTGVYDVLELLVPGTWYNTWVLVDHSSDTYQVWMNADPGGDAQASDQLDNDAAETLFGFRTATATNLINFFIKTGSGASPVDGRFYIDDIYLENTGDINLSNPLGDGDNNEDGADDNLVYVAVEPCRIVDTRNAAGAILAETSRNFLVSGTAGELGVQGGITDCPAPRAGSKPLAVSAYVLAVKTATSGNGVLTAFPSNTSGATPPVGSGSTVNFTAQQNIGNTTTIKLCAPTGACPANGEFAILARSSDQHTIIDVQGYYYAATGSCTDDMVAAGSLCVDRYEASLWDAASGGTQIPASTCLADGSNCGADGLNTAIFAQSVAGVFPAVAPSWFQASIACANVGKRLPSATEWQMAAAGTNAASCNVTSGVLAITGASPDCVSTAGAFDMVGNLWEWTADLTPDVTSGGTSAQTSLAAGFGDSHAGLAPTPGTDTMFTPGDGTIATNPDFGFRCVR